MPIDSKHPDFIKNFYRWQKCRHAVEGEDAIKANGVEYLPALEGQEGDDYERYKKRAQFLGASARTVRGLAGAVLRKPTTYQTPVKALLDTIGVDDEPADSIIKTTLEEVLGVGRVGLYVDSDAGNYEEGENINPDPNAPPYVCVYFAENIINWGEVAIGGRKQLSMVVLEEKVNEQDENDEFEWRECTHYRVVKLLDAATPNPYIEVTVWEKDEDAAERNAGRSAEEARENEWQIVYGPVNPTFRGGKKIPYIPFVFVNPSALGPKAEKSPIMDLVNVNLSHYRNSADYEHGLHFTALPTAWAAGFNTASTELKIGSEVAWISEDPSAKTGYLEFTGAGLKTLKEAMDDKKKEMAMLGARLLEEQKADAEAAETVRLRHSGEESVLINIVHSVEKGLETVLNWLAEWTGNANATTAVTINKDFNPLGLDVPTLMTMIQAVQSGLMSYDVWYYNLERGEMLPDGWTKDKEKTLIQAGFPMLPQPDLTQDQADKGGGGGAPKAARSSGGANLDMGQP